MTNDYPNYVAEIIPADLTDEMTNNRKETLTDFGIAIMGALNSADIATDIPNILTEIENINVALSEQAFDIACTITRATIATPYAIGQIINSNGATTLPELDFSTFEGSANRKIEITQISLLSSNGNIISTAALQPIVHIFDATSLSGQALTDATVFAPSYNQIDAHLQTIFKSELDTANAIFFGTNCYSINTSEMSKIVTLDANGKIYLALIAGNTYTPSSGETIKVNVRGYLH